MSAFGFCRYDNKTAADEQCEEVGGTYGSMNGAWGRGGHLQPLIRKAHQDVLLCLQFVGISQAMAMASGFRGFMKFDNYHQGNRISPFLSADSTITFFLGSPIPVKVAQTVLGIYKCNLLSTYINWHAFSFG